MISTLLHLGHFLSISMREQVGIDENDEDFDELHNC